jgi:ABC-2 type transport system permease protein
VSKVSTLGLAERKADGSIRQGEKVDELQTFVLPFGLMYLLFIAVMTSAPQLLNAVIEEKMSRISEVLIASVTPFQLMMGKLIGTTVVAVLLALVYFMGGAYAVFATGRWDLLQAPLLMWFMVFLVCAVLIYGSIFLSIGAASSDIKDAQGMMQTAMVLVMLPIFVAPVILRAPESSVSVATSLFPTATPFLMLIRLAMKPGPPMWQVGLSVVLTLLTACAFVWAAGRIFRVGLLMQGKGATFAEMFRWIRA